VLRSDRIPHSAAVKMEEWLTPLWIPLLYSGSSVNPLDVGRIVPRARIGFAILRSKIQENFHRRVSHCSLTNSLFH
jgi:hypothetical protein